MPPHHKRAYLKYKQNTNEFWRPPLDTVRVLVSHERPKNIQYVIFPFNIYWTCYKQIYECIEALPSSPASFDVEYFCDFGEIFIYSLFYGYFLTRTIDGHFWVSKYFFNCWVFYVWDHCEISWGWCSWLRLRWRSPAQPPSYWHQELIESNQEQPTPGKLKQKIIYQCTCAELSHFKGKSRSSFHIQLVGE